MPPEATGIADVSDDIVPPEIIGELIVGEVIVLLVSIWVSVVPTIFPKGATTDESKPSFLTITPGVKVPTPVPPFESGSMPEVDSADDKLIADHEGAPVPFDFKNWLDEPEGTKDVVLVDD